VTIRFRCDKCDRGLRAQPRSSGKALRCPACGSALVVPGQVADGPQLLITSTRPRRPASARRFLSPYWLIAAGAGIGLVVASFFLFLSGDRRLADHKATSQPELGKVVTVQKPVIANGESSRTIEHPSQEVPVAVSPEVTHQATLAEAAKPSRQDNAPPPVTAIPPANSADLSLPVAANPNPKGETPPPINPVPPAKTAELALPVVAKPNPKGETLSPPIHAIKPVETVNLALPVFAKPSPKGETLPALVKTSPDKPLPEAKEVRRRTCLLVHTSCYDQIGDLEVAAAQEAALRKGALAGKPSTFRAPRSVVAEVVKAMGKLAEDEHFQVLFFNDRVHPSPHGWLSGQQDMAKAAAWLDVIKKDKAQAPRLVSNLWNDGGYDPVPAFTAAFRLEPRPDVIFYYTDNKTPADLPKNVADLNGKNPKVTINTVLIFQSVANMGNFPMVGFETPEKRAKAQQKLDAAMDKKLAQFKAPLQELAEASGGTCTVIRGVPGDKKQVLPRGK
jgi:hypothetical protein